MASLTGPALSSFAGAATQSSLREWREKKAMHRATRSKSVASNLETALVGPTAVGPGVVALPNDVSSRFGRRLRELRLSRDLTQADMARKFGIDRSFISEMECGRKAVSLPVLEVIALGLQVSLSELFEGL